MGTIAAVVAFNFPDKDRTRQASSRRFCLRRSRSCAAGGFQNRGRAPTGFPHGEPRRLRPRFAFNPGKTGGTVPCPGSRMPAATKPRA